MWEIVFPYNIDTYYCLSFLADVMPVNIVSEADVICLADVNALCVYGRCYSQEVDVIPLSFEWQMLLPFCFNGRCCCHFLLFWQIFYVSVYCNYNTG